MPNDVGTEGAAGARTKSGEISAKDIGGSRESKTGEASAGRTGGFLQGRVESNHSALKSSEAPAAKQETSKANEGARQVIRNVLRSTNEALQPLSFQLKSAETGTKTLAKGVERFARDSHLVDTAEFVQNLGKKTQEFLKTGLNEKARDAVRQVLRKADRGLQPLSGTLKKTEMASAAAARATERFAEKSGLADTARTVQEVERDVTDAKNFGRGVKNFEQALKSVRNSKGLVRDAGHIENRLPGKFENGHVREQPSRRLEGAEREAAEARLETVHKRLEHVETRMLGDPKAAHEFLQKGISRDAQPGRHAKVETLWNNLKSQERSLERDLHLDRLERRLPGLRAEIQQATGKSKQRLQYRFEATERRIETLKSEWTQRKDVRDDWKFVKAARDGKEYVFAYGKLSKPSEIINWRRDSAIGKKLDAAARRGVGKNGDHAGHLAAVRYGADPREAVNLTSQNSKMNIGRGWADVESGLAARAEHEPSGTLRARIKSVRGGGRETHRTLTVKQYGETVSVTTRSGNKETEVKLDGYTAANPASPPKEIPSNLRPKENLLNPQPSKQFRREEP